MTAHSSTVGTAYDLPASPARHAPRRNREELEALAAEFVNSKLVVRTPEPTWLRKPLPKPLVAALGAAGGAALIGLLAAVFWPSAQETTAVTAGPGAVEAELWAQRLEQQRERKRQELERSRQYLAKMAAADSALVGEMSSRAQGLAARADRPASRPVDEPTPKSTSQPAPAFAAEHKPAPQAAVAPAQVPAQAPAKAAPAPARVAAAAQCNIHVSELSSSGKLTYADVARMKGTRTNAAGHVFTPPLKAADGRTVVFEVMPSGCVRVERGR